jgi:hypothetical protein
MTGFTHLRNTLTHHLVASGLKNIKVIYTCCATNCAGTANTDTRLRELRTVTAQYGIHYTPEGHKNLANRCIKCLQTMCLAPVKLQKMRSSFWHSFRSPSGSASANAQCQPVAWARAGHQGGSWHGGHTCANPPRRGSLVQGRIRLVNKVINTMP